MSHAGLARQLADRTGLTAALPWPLGGHDRDRVFAGLACAIADGARAISDFRVMGDARVAAGCLRHPAATLRKIEARPAQKTAVDQ